MRKLLPIAVIVISIGIVFAVIIINNTKHSHKHYSHTPATPVVPIKKLDTDISVLSEESNNIETTVVHTDTVDTEAQPQWLENPKPQSTNKNKTDPFTSHMIEQKQREDEEWLFEDPQTMNPEDRRKVMYKTLLKRHGDIPAVHDFIDYDRKSEQNDTLPIEEEIKGLEAVYELFPSDTNRKNLSFYKWLASKNITLKSVGDISDEDIAELRSLGIQVKLDSTDHALRRISILTK